MLYDPEQSEGQGNPQVFRRVADPILNSIKNNQYCKAIVYNDVVHVFLKEKPKIYIPIGIINF